MRRLTINYNIISIKLQEYFRGRIFLDMQKPAFLVPMGRVLAGVRTSHSGRGITTCASPLQRRDVAVDVGNDHGAGTHGGRPGRSPSTVRSCRPATYHVNNLQSCGKFKKRLVGRLLAAYKLTAFQREVCWGGRRLREAPPYDYRCRFCTQRKSVARTRPRVPPASATTLISSVSF